MNAFLEFGSRVAPLRAYKQRRHLREQRRRAILEGWAHPLSQAQVGQWLRVVGIAGEHEFEITGCFGCRRTMSQATRQRIQEMGIIPGTQIRLLANGDPVIVSLWDGRTAMGRALACEIFVVPENGESTLPAESECAA